MQNSAHIKSFEILGKDTFFNVEIAYNGEVSHEALIAEKMEELIKRGNIEVTYDEDFSSEDETTIDQVIEHLNMTHAEVTDFETDGQFDVYLHKVVAKYGELSYDVTGQFVASYKTEKSANKKVIQITSGTGHKA